MWINYYCPFEIAASLTRFARSLLAMTGGLLFSFPCLVNKRWGRGN